MKASLFCVAAAAVLAGCVSGFTVSLSPSSQFPATVLSRSSTSLSMSRDPFEIMVKLPPTNSDLQAQMKVQPVLPGESELVEIRYKIPFGLDVAPKDNLAVCTKDGPGGEKVGDVLRYTSQWTLGLPRGDGLVTTAASFAGGLQWQCSMFDVLAAKRWEEVVEALTTNTDSRTDEVVLLFERSTESE